MRSRKFVLIVLALFAVLIASGLGGFSLAPAALAQSSTSYDLGCWGLFVSGDTRQSPTYRLRDVVGQWAGGTSTSPAVIVRGGYVQNWASLYTTPIAESMAVEPKAGDPADWQLYLPLVTKQILVFRTCVW